MNLIMNYFCVANNEPKSNADGDNKTTDCQCPSCQLARMKMYSNADGNETNTQESIKDYIPMILIFGIVGIGMVGALTALWLTDNSLSFVAVVGLIALAGIEIKNTILLVDFTNQLREEGKSLDEAIREAGEIRFLPIILTSLTAIGGLIPIALSTNPLISPLAIVIIGGLISSTLLSRIFTPVIYKLIPPKIQQ